MSNQKSIQRHFSELWSTQLTKSEYNYEVQLWSTIMKYNYELNPFQIVFLRGYSQTLNLSGWLECHMNYVFVADLELVWINEQFYYGVVAFPIFLLMRFLMFTYQIDSEFINLLLVLMLIWSSRWVWWLACLSSRAPA